MHDIHEARHLENKMSGCSWASWGEWVWCLPVSHSANSSWQKQSSCYKMTGNRDKTESSQTLILNPNSKRKVHTVWICCTGNGAFGLTGHTGQCSPFGLFLHFPCDIHPTHTVQSLSEWDKTVLFCLLQTVSRYPIRQALYNNKFNFQSSLATVLWIWRKNGHEEEERRGSEEKALLQLTLFLAGSNYHFPSWRARSVGWFWFRFYCRSRPYNWGFTQEWGSSLFFQVAPTWCRMHN